jgi:hypothetical protein
LEKQPHGALMLNAFNIVILWRILTFLQNTFRNHYFISLCTAVIGYLVNLICAINTVFWICGGGIPTQLILLLQMVCTFIGTFCKYTTCIMRSLKRCSWCYWSVVDCDGRATVVQVGWCRCCLEDCWEFCSSSRLARWGFRFSEAQWSQRVDLVGSH